MMIDFRVYDESDAPEAARPMLEAAKKRMGFVTTLNGVMAESPELLAGYNALAEQFGKSSLPGPAKQVVLITASTAWPRTPPSRCARVSRPRWSRHCGLASRCRMRRWKPFAASPR
jgi:hypothetical protein